ncbi:MAG: MFS transporter [Burkholderiaceae bacterium]
MSDTTRLKGFFFAYFAYVGMFSPYLSLYLADAGFSIAQIGILMSLPQWMRIVAPPFWGWLADSRGRPDQLMRLSSVLTLTAVCLLHWSSGGSIWVVGLVLAVLFFVSAAQVPIGEAQTLSVTAGDAGEYGKIRLWGSIGFILAVASLGPVLDALGTQTLPLWMAGVLVLLVAIVWSFKSNTAPPSASAALVRLRDRLRQTHIAAFFLANFLMIFAHAAYYVLYSLYLEEQGYSKTAIGALWTLGVVAEVALFRWQRHLFSRFSALGMLGFSIAIAAVRFALIGWSAGVLWLLILAQLMHAITFGLHHSAVMKILHQWFDVQQQARAQALYVTLAYGLGGALGGLVVSGLWVHLSPAGAFYGAGLAAAVGACLTLIAIRRAPAPLPS